MKSRCFFVFGHEMLVGQFQADEQFDSFVEAKTAGQVQARSAIGALGRSQSWGLFAELFDNVSESVATSDLERSWRMPEVQNRCFSTCSCKRTWTLSQHVKHVSSDTMLHRQLSRHLAITQNSPVK